MDEMKWGDVFNLVAALASVATAVFAWLGLQTWRHQLQANLAHDLGRRYRLAAFKLREALRNVRSPRGHVTLEEAATDVRALKINLYSWRKGKKDLGAAVVEMRSVVVEVEATWGKEDSKPGNTLAFDAYMLRYDAASLSEEFDHDTHSKTDAYLQNRMTSVEKLFYPSTRDEEDSHGVFIDQLVESIVEITQRHMNL